MLDEGRALRACVCRASDNGCCCVTAERKRDIARKDLRRELFRVTSMTSASLRWGVLALPDPALR